MKRISLFSTAATFLLILTSAASGQSLTALTTTNQLLSYDVTNVSNPAAPLLISGLTGGEVMLGIDYRPANGLLYGVTNASRLYTINTTTGAAALVATLSTPLNLAGTNPGIGFDFNPVPDRLRIIANRSGQNLRVDPSNGIAVVDTTLSAYPVGDAFAGQLPNVSAVGYLPNTGGVTTLFGFDDVTDRIVRIGGVNGTPSPNLGAVATLAGIGGISGSNLAGMDVGDQNNVGYLSLDLGSNIFRLFQIDLTVTNPTTNSATLLGTFNAGGLAITDIAIVPVPEPGTLPLCGLAAFCFAGYRRRKARGYAIVAARSAA